MLEKDIKKIKPGILLITKDYWSRWRPGVGSVLMVVGIEIYDDEKHFSMTALNENGCELYGGSIKEFLWHFEIYEKEI